MPNIFQFRFNKTKKNKILSHFLVQERLTSHSGIGLSGGTPAYNTHTGHSGRAVTTGSGHTGSGTGHSSGHGPSPSMHHQALQSDFQPPYFPPPFHHATQSPPQQQNHGPLEYLSADPYGQPLSSLHHAPLHHYNQLTGLRPTQDQLGIHRTHREAELQGHAVSVIHTGILSLSVCVAFNEIQLYMDIRSAQTHSCCTCCNRERRFKC